MKDYNNTNVNKIVLWSLIMSLVVVSTIYFGKCYLLNHELIFKWEDKIILLIFGISILLTILIMVFLIIKVINLEKLLIDISEILIESEDNLIINQRMTQNMIMKLSKRLGVDIFEKKH